MSLISKPKNLDLCETFTRYQLDEPVEKLLDDCDRGIDGLALFDKGQLGPDSVKFVKEWIGREDMVSTEMLLHVLFKGDRVALGEATTKHRQTEGKLLTRARLRAKLEAKRK